MGIINIYQINDFKLINSINIKEKTEEDNSEIIAIFNSRGNIIFTCDNYAYLIEFNNNEYLIKEIFDDIDVHFIIEIPENKHYVVGNDDINIYNYNYEKILNISPVYSNIGMNNPCNPPTRSLLYLPKLQFLICIKYQYGFASARAGGVTIIDTKNAFYKIIWGNEYIWVDIYHPYCINIINNKYLLIDNELYDLKNGEKKYWIGKSKIEFYGTNIISFGNNILNLYDKNDYLELYDYNFVEKEGKIDGLVYLNKISFLVRKERKERNIDKHLVKITEKTFCFYSGYNIYFFELNKT